jgi:hypothetical protein
MSPITAGSVYTTWKYGTGRELGLALGQPLACCSALTLGAAPIAAAIVGDNDVSARLVLTAPDMAAERRRAAALDRTHALHLAEADVAGIGLAPRCPMVKEDSRDLQQWTGHGRYAVGWSLLPPLFGFLGLLTRLRQPVKRALDAGDQAGCDARVARRRVQFVVTQQRLDDLMAGPRA